MYTRKLTTKTKTRKGKRTMGKRVGKSVNKKRFGKKSMRKSVNKNRNNRNNNRRTKRAGFGQKNFFPNAAKHMVNLGLRNTGSAINFARALQEGDERALKAVGKKAFNDHKIAAQKITKEYGGLKQLEADAIKYANKYKIPNPLGFVDNLTHPQLRQPGVSGVQPPIVPTGNQQAGPFQNFVR